MPRKSDNHRKIYEKYHGPIGKDSNGRSLEVHHIDGNHSNNEISNLKLVTIQEHYDIHYAQGDWAACALMAKRAMIPPEEVSRLSRMAQQALVDAGTHHWLGGAHNKKRINEGTHNFLDKEAARERNLKRVAVGTHNLLTENNPSTVLAKAGQHHFQLNNPTHKRINEGTHHFITDHPNKLQVTCLACRKTGGYTNMKRYHLDNCKSLKILPSND